MKNAIIISLMIFISPLAASACFAQTAEIKLNYDFSPELTTNARAIGELKGLLDEYIKMEADPGAALSFDYGTYRKLDAFILRNLKTRSGLTALYMVPAMIFPEDTDLHGKQMSILDYLIDSQSACIQGKMAIIAKAVALEGRGQKKEAVKLLEDKYEVILSIEKDPYFSHFLDELSIKGKEDENVMAIYYTVLSSILIQLGDLEPAAERLERIVKQYPQTSLAASAKKKLESISRAKARPKDNNR